MKISAVAVLVSLVFGGAALADPRPTIPPRGIGKVCMNTQGLITPAACRTQNGSRIRVDPDICLCPAGLRTAAAPYCEVGEKPAPDSAAAGRARTAAWEARHTLEGASFEGRRFCVERGRTGES